jgi:hypothetical protein
MADSENSILDYSAIPQNGYAAFDAISLRNLIVERLNKQGTFTDQNYIGSNLASIIDIISYSFHTLMFYLNKTSTESMFTEAQLYENINRIVKLLDYKPVGYQSSTLPFGLTILQNALADNFYLIPRYSYIRVGGVTFSFNEDVTFSLNNQITQSPGLINLADISYNKLLYQGVFRSTPIYDAVGDDNEVVVLNMPNASIDHFNIHVYVWEYETERWYQYKEVQSLIDGSPFDRVFEKRLNSNQIYEMTFGDNINGRKLVKGDQVLIYFLQSSKDDGVIGSGTLDNAERSSSGLGKNVFSDSVFLEVFSDTRQDISSVPLVTETFKNLRFSNAVGSTLPKEIETVESIRKNAPLNFKGQYRLVTLDDYEGFIKTNFSHFVSDVKVFDNWTYTGKYLKYFNDLKINATTFQQIALNQTLYADACNFNNVYVCAVPRISPNSTLKYLMPSQKELITSQLKPLKTLTTETTFLDPIYKNVSFGFDINSDPAFTLDASELFKLQITKDPNNNRTNQSIIADVASVLQNYFNVPDQTLGNPFDYAGLLREILSVNGVQKIKTIIDQLDDDLFAVDSPQITEFEGLSFIVWNPVYPELDQKFVSGNFNVNPFDFILFPNLATISNKIVVV